MARSPLRDSVESLFQLKPTFSPKHNNNANKGIARGRIANLPFTPPKLPFTSYARRDVYERRIDERFNNPLQVLHLNA